jgi:methionine-gamma-lyase
MRRPRPSCPKEVPARHPESLMMGYAYHPEWSEGALKSPIFQTSTFVFRSAEEGKHFFSLAYGLQAPEPGEIQGLIYSRINNPDLEILEERLRVWDDAEACAVFNSGMAAITTMLFEILRPGDAVLFSEPVYGGTDHFLKKVLTRWGIRAVPIPPFSTEKEILAIAKSLEGSLAMIYIETPANPTNILTDIAACARVAKACSRLDRKVLTAVDNTFLGPLFQHPLRHGADLVVYSATKFIGGHSDVVAGAVLGSCELISAIKANRTFHGTLAGPWTGWLILRSLETLKLRMTCQMKNAQKVAAFLAEHPRIRRVLYPGFLKEGDPQREIYDRQCLKPGALISFEVDGGEAEAFEVLNRLRLVKLAVSLGGTESLAEHPASMTHADVDPDTKRRLGISDSLVRLSVGVENPDDIADDLNQALSGAGILAAPRGMTAERRS